MISGGVGRVTHQDAHRVGDIWSSSQHEIHELTDCGLESMNAGDIHNVLGKGVWYNLLSGKDSSSWGDLSLIGAGDCLDCVTGKVDLIKGNHRVHKRVFWSRKLYRKCNENYKSHWQILYIEKCKESQNFPEIMNGTARKV